MLLPLVAQLWCNDSLVSHTKMFAFDMSIALPPPSDLHEVRSLSRRHYEDALLPPAGPVQAAFANAKPKPLNNGDWLRLWIDALVFPVRGDGAFVLIPGFVLAVILLLGSGFGFVVSVAIIGVGYFAGYFEHIVEQTTSGHDDAIDWQDCSDLVQQLLWPSLRFIMFCVLVSLLSAATLWAAEQISCFCEAGLLFPSPVTTFGRLLAGRISLTLWSCLALFVYLGVIVRGSILFILPHHWWPAFRTTCRQFFVVAAFITGMFWAWFFISNTILSVFVIGPLLSVLLGFYLLISTARLLGLFYREHGGILGWGV